MSGGSAAAGSIPPPLAAKLAQFAHGLHRDQIAEPAAGHAALLILDAVGCALAGWAGEETPQVLRVARGLGGPGEYTIIGDAGPASLIGAVMANAYLTTAVTCCDVYTPAHCHLTPEVVPAALAVAEKRRVSGPALLTAVTAGLEVTSRLLRAIDYADFRSRGWHAPGVFGPVGAAVAAGLLLGLDERELIMAMSLAVSQAAGTFAAWPTAAVKFHQARGAVAGVVAAQLAAEGFAASPEPFLAPDGGLFRSYSPGDPVLAVADLGRCWELEQISLRLWPGATPVQALLTALLGSGAALPPAADLAAVQIRVPPATYQAHHHLAHPVGCFDALLSFHYVAALILLHGRFDIDLAGPAYRAGQDVTMFIDQRIALVPDPGVPRGGVHVTLTTRSGATVDIRQEHALGTPQLPATRSQVEGKFLRAARTRLSPGLGEELLADLSGLDRVPDCSDLIRRSREVSPAVLSQVSSR
ncbi:MAG: MmgE/PrpD family protein [Streptosporangiaceae bacterium]